MTADAQTRKIVEALIGRIKAAPGVTIGRIEREVLGKRPGYLRWAKANGGLRLGHLVAILDHLRLPVAELVDPLDPHPPATADPADRFVAEATRGRDAGPPWLATLRRRHLEAPAPPASAPPQPTRHRRDACLGPCPAASGTELLAELCDLDDWRYLTPEDARRAEVRARRIALDSDRPEVVATALGVAASARHMLRQPGAQRFLATALDVARRHGATESSSQLEQRVVAVRRIRNPPDVQIELIQRAIVHAVRTDHPRQLGWSLAQHASIAQTQNRHREALGLLARAEAVLAGCDVAARCSLAGLRLASETALGELRQAARTAQRLGSLAGFAPRVLAASAHHALGRFERGRGDLDSAQRHFETARDSYGYPLGARLAALEAIALRLGRGAVAAAHEAARRLLEVGDPVDAGDGGEETPEAVIEAVCAAYRGDLETRDVHRATAALIRQSGWAQVAEGSVIRCRSAGTCGHASTESATSPGDRSAPGSTAAR